jgi:hypothetical protein
MKKTRLIERFQQLAGIKSLYELEGEQSTISLNVNWMDIEDKYLNKPDTFSDGSGFGEFEYDHKLARVYYIVDPNALGSIGEDDKDFYYDLKTRDFVMPKYIRQNYWHVLPPEDKAVWNDIKNIIDQNIEEK